MKIKRLTVSLCFLLLLALTACSAAGNQAAGTSAASSSTQTATAATAQTTAADKTDATQTATQTAANSVSAETWSLADIPAFSDQPYVILENNQPSFADSDFTENSFESYSDLDALGRCQVAFANIGKDLMPTEERGSIGEVKPTGWHTVKYDIISGKYLYNRCHLIGYQLTGENANPKNLITGTRYMNVEGMEPFENMVADHIKETGQHVLYRVTPIFDGDNLVASGVEMEAESVEDHGAAICFHVFVYNNQPGIQINYSNGDSELLSEAGSSNQPDSAAADTSAADAAAAESAQNVAEQADSGSASDDSAEIIIRGNSKSKIYHCPGQADYEEMADSKNLVVFHSEQEAIDAGYRKAKR